MKVLINAASANVGGSVTYLKNIVHWLPIVEPTISYEVIAPAATIERIGPDNAGGRMVVRNFPYSRTGGVGRLYFDQVALPLYVARNGFDLLFSSTGFGSLVPLSKQILLIRNTIYFDKLFLERSRQKGQSTYLKTLRRWLSLLSVRASTYTLFPTLAMEAEVRQYLELPRGQYGAIHYGFDPAAMGIQARNGKGIERAPGQRIVLLNVSTFYVQKNFDTLVEAVADLVRRGHDIELWLTIGADTIRERDRADYNALIQRVERLGVRDRIKELGHVPYKELGSLYARADVFTWSSFSESFGHSLVEAMAAGLPVIAADVPVNREVCADAALFFSAFDPADCADRIESVLAQQTMWEQMHERALRRAEHFSWEEYAAKLAALFLRVGRREKS